MSLCALGVAYCCGDSRFVASVTARRAIRAGSRDVTPATSVTRGHQTLVGWLVPGQAAGLGPAAAGSTPPSRSLISHISKGNILYPLSRSTASGHCPRCPTSTPSLTPRHNFSCLYVSDNHPIPSVRKGGVWIASLEVSGVWTQITRNAYSNQLVTATMSQGDTNAAVVIDSTRQSRKMSHQLESSQRFSYFLLYKDFHNSISSQIFFHIIF